MRGREADFQRKFSTEVFNGRTPEGFFFRSSSEAGRGFADNRRTEIEEMAFRSGNPRGCLIGRPEAFSPKGGMIPFRSSPSGRGDAPAPSSARRGQVNPESFPDVLGHFHARGVRWTIRAAPVTSPYGRLLLIERKAVGTATALWKRTGARRRFEVNWCERRWRFTLANDAGLLAVVYEDVYREALACVRGLSF